MISFNTQTVNACKILKEVSQASKLEQVFVTLRVLDYAELSPEQRRLATKWETLVVMADNLLSEVINEMSNELKS